MAISLQSYNEILGKLVRKIIADTAVNDINTGSVLLTLLEAVAAQDFENNTAILSVLETLNVDALKNIDLDTRAADYGLVRRTSVRATGSIKIYDSSISKRATALYSLKPAPIAGATKIYVNNASGWDFNSGELYIGRGTLQFEGPIGYGSPDGGVTPGIEFNGSFYTIHLTSTLKKDHLISDSVIDRQGKEDRLIPAGTIVKIPLNNLTPEIRYLTLRDSVLPAGEDHVDGVTIVADEAGTQANSGINTIVQFDSQPFEFAAVTNTSPAVGGRDVESDEELRERIKNYASTLARGTRAAILASVVGISDSTDGKQVSSAVITEPASIGDPSIAYIDDGTGFQPSFAGQSVDTILASATGDEEFLQLSNFPLPRPQVINQTSGPVELTNGMFLRVRVDSVEEQVVFTTKYFLNIAAATLPEIAAAINSQATDGGFGFRCRLSDNSSRLLLYPVSHDAEYIQVSPIRQNDDPTLYANTILKFPTNKYSYITLYKNNTLLTEKQLSASLESKPAPWGISTAGELTIQVDGTPPQTNSFNLSDFTASVWSAITLQEWANVFNSKFAGITASVTSSNRLQIVSNRTGSLSSLKILSGDYISQIFEDSSLESKGSDSQFALNRQTGNLQLKIKLSLGDTITAGAADAKGNIQSNPTSSGSYNLSTDAEGRPAELVVVTDGNNVFPRTDVKPVVGATITVPDLSSTAPNVMRILCSSVGVFQQAQVDDYIYIAPKTSSWLSAQNTGIFKIIKKGSHLDSATSYIDVANPNVVAEGPFTITTDTDIQVFSSDVYPQIWRGSYLPAPATASLKDIATSLSNDIVNVKSSIFKTTSLKTTSSTENGGAICTPVSIGNASLAFPTARSNEFGNQSHIASSVNEKDLFSFFKRTQPVSQNVWLDRFSYSSQKTNLSDNSNPNVGEYSEVLTSSLFNESNISYDDIVKVTSGSNKSQFRSIKNLPSADQLGTQVSLPRTEFSYSSGDQIDVMESLSIAADDSIVFIIDGDAVNSTVNVNMWRTGKVNSSYAPSGVAFSADDADNESGVNFGTLQVWSKDTGTDFSDYAVWMRSHNWYRTGGANATNAATMIIRAKEYGPTGEKYRFSIEYPSTPDQTASVEHDVTPDYCLTTYHFASGSQRSTGIVGGTTFKVTSVGAPSDYVWRYAFQQPSVDFSSVLTGDILSISSSGVSAANSGTFYINSIDLANRSIDIYNPNGAETSVGSPEVTNITAIADVPGTAMEQTITTTAPGVAAGQVSTQDYFVLYDDVGKVVFWYDVGNTGAPAPTVSGAYRYVKISTIVNSVPAVQTIATTAQGAAAGLVDNGRYFILYDDVGAVVFWYDISGSTPEPSVPFSARKVKISTVAASDTAVNIAVKTATAIDNDLKFSAISAGNTIAVTNSFFGPSTTGLNGPNLAFVFTSVVAGVIGDTADSVATKTATVIDGDVKFSATTSTNVITVVNSFVGPVTAGSAGLGLSFVFATTVSGVTAASLGGKYFKIYDQSGSVAVWYNTGFSSLPPHGCNRAIQVSIPPGASASIVAATTASFVGADAAFSASAVNAVVTITDAVNGLRSSAADGTAPYETGFAIASTKGVDDGVETITSTPTCSIFPLTANSVSEICETINTSQTLTAVPVGNSSLTIVKATRDEVYAHDGTDSSALGYGHDPDPTTNLNTYVGMFDGESFVQTFSNSNPHFLLKKELLLPGVVPSIYSMNSCPNPGSAETGEYFKLIPKTINNIKHHFTQKALSQLPIVADVDIAKNFRRIQIKSKKLGTTGAIEVVGGRANIGEFSIFDDAAVEQGIDGTQYLQIKTSAYPATLNSGDLVEIYNNLPAKRKSRLTNTSTISVESAGAGEFDYKFNPRKTRITPFTNWTITDVSSSYGKISGIVWRWTHTSSGGKVSVSAKTNGSIPVAPGAYKSDGNIADNSHVYEYEQGAVNKKMQFAMAVSSTPSQGDYFYFAAVDGSTYAVWLNVDNDDTPPASSQFSSANYKIEVNITSSDSLNSIAAKVYNELNTPSIPANEAGKDAFMSDFSSSNVLGTSLDDVREGDLLNVSGTLDPSWSAGNVSSSPGESKICGFPVIKVDAENKYVDVINPVGQQMLTENFSGEDGTISISPTPSIRFRLRHAANSTKYRIESLGALDLFRIVWTDGQKPYFADCGTAVDDFVLLSGDSFNSANLGRFRILAVDNESLTIQHAKGVEELHTYKKFSSSETLTTWTAGSTIVTGAINAFSNVNPGDWIKKKEDTEDKFAQVYSVSVSKDQVVLGQTYRGTTGLAYGVVTNFENDVNFGSLLLNADDLQIFEGDSVVIGDSLVIDSYTNPNWFNQVNSGVRAVTGWGTKTLSDTPYLSPYLRVYNPNGIAQEDRQIGLKSDGFYVLESENNKYKSVRKIENAAINQLNFAQRVLYATPADRSYKMSNSYETKVRSLGKLGFPLGTVTGIDGYLYYTGLMRTVQRTIDGYEPDSSTYPGQRAVGSAIEVLPPLIKQVSLALRIVTKDGVNLTDITNEIKSAIINYISTLGVGEDVILSEIIARVKNIIGIEAVTITTPNPSEERIPVADDEKALITPELINLS